MEKLVRVNWMIEPGQRAALEALAEKSGRSVSELVREMLRRELDGRADRPPQTAEEVLSEIHERAAQYLGRR